MTRVLILLVLLVLAGTAYWARAAAVPLKESHTRSVLIPLILLVLMLLGNAASLMAGSVQGCMQKQQVRDLGLYKGMSYCVCCTRALADVLTGYLAHLIHVGSDLH